MRQDETQGSQATFSLFGFIRMFVSFWIDDGPNVRFGSKADIWLPSAMGGKRTLTRAPAVRALTAATEFPKHIAPRANYPLARQIARVATPTLGMLALRAGPRHDEGMPKSSSYGTYGITLRDSLTSAGLKSSTIEKIVGLPSRTVLLEPRQPYRQPGAPRDEVVFVRNGLLSIYKTDGVGKRQIIALRFCGEGILPSANRSDYGIQAIVPTEAIIWRADDFNSMTNSDPEFQRFLRTTVERHASIGYQWLINCGHRDATERVAHLLCETAERNISISRRDGFVNPFTQKQIGEITGQTPVNVNRVLAELERDGVIQRGEKRLVKVSDWQELRRRGRFQPSYLQ